jgi:hypothetical protein
MLLQTLFKRPWLYRATLSINLCFFSQAFAAAGFASRADVIRILQDERFEVVYLVDKIPYEDLVWARVIGPGRKLSSFIVDPGREYESQDGWVDVTKPFGQLIVAGVSGQHEVLCFWRAATGGPVPFFMVVQRAGVKSRVIFYATLDGDVRTWADVKRLVFEDKISTLISAEHPHDYKGER